MDNRTIIQQSLDYIEDNLKTEITAAELAEMAGFSLFHYYRLFQQATGLPVMQYILRRRLLHGVYAMKRGSGKTDAAFCYGFDTYAGFYRAFCREFGATPSAFLESSRAKRPCRIDITREEHMTVTHKKTARILKHWDLSHETVTDIYYEGTGTKNDSACYVGEDYVLKYTANLGKLKKNIEVSRVLETSACCLPYRCPPPMVQTTLPTANCISTSPADCRVRRWPPTGSVRATDASWARFWVISILPSPGLRTASVKRICLPP